MENKFASRLKEVRELRGWSQQELSKRSGLQVTAISHFENGKRTPSFENLRKLSDALSVASDFLLGREEKPQIAGEKMAQLFRNVEKMTDDDINAMQMMANALVAKGDQSGENK